MHSVSPSPGRVALLTAATCDKQAVTSRLGDELGSCTRGTKTCRKMSCRDWSRGGWSKNWIWKFGCLGEQPGGEQRYDLTTRPHPAHQPALILPDERCPTTQFLCSNLPVCQGKSIGRAALESSCVSVVALHL